MQATVRCMAKLRSPNYPAVSLAAARDTVRKLYAKEGGASVTPDVAVKSMGYQGLTGPSRSRLAALKKYGLLEDAAGKVRVSPLALTILHGPPDEQQRALREAAVKPELFRELSEIGGSDENLRYELLRNGFTLEGATRAISAYRETMSLAPGEASGYDSSEPEDDAMLDATQTDKLDLRYSGSVGDAQRPPVGYRFMWPLPDGVTVSVEFRGGPLTAKGVEMLTRYLELAKETVAASPSPSAPPLPDARSLSSSQD
jgi:hypothetical protein